ncbi:MAG: hypothetical protein BWY63_00671 [Chloroflexi bacterium ADurb.Bin360]|nr:MAG: hypothetical protein BWY63_00671 [Chloroflexi bacterium ADurb.Bin360]
MDREHVIRMSLMMFWDKDWLPFELGAFSISYRSHAKPQRTLRGEILLTTKDTKDSKVEFLRGLGALA